MDTADRKKIENANRDRLYREKPLVFEKIVKLNERFLQGLATPVIDIGYNLTCNLKCRHCFTSRFIQKERKLTPNDLRKLSNEAHALGLCQFVISGGEPLIFKDLPEVIKALQPDKFHLSMSTNGHFMTKEMACKLKQWGLDKVKISLDDFDESKHNKNRNSDDAYQKAIDAMMNAKDAGLSVIIQTVVTHQNCKSSRIVQMAKFAQEQGFIVDVMVAHAVGQWEGRHDLLIDAEDAAYLRQVREQYPTLHRDTFATYGIERGCGCVNSNLHLTQYGDVLPCGFIHISLGNIFEESLTDILQRGMNIKSFKEFNPLCISGEDRNFIEKYMTKFYGKALPVHWSEVFSDEDFIG